MKLLTIMELAIESIFAALFMLIKTVAYLVASIALLIVATFFYLFAIFTIPLDLMVFILSAGKGKLESTKSFLQAGTSVRNCIPKIARSFYGK